MNPIDLLPIQHPSEYEPEDPLYFYKNVIQVLIPDILRVTSNGMPIDLNKVRELEEVVSNVLKTVHEKLCSNKLMLDFLQKEAKKSKANKTELLEAKKKTVEDFYKPFDCKNKIHRSYVTNLYLGANCKADMKQDEWSIKDLKILNQIIASKFIQDLVDKTLDNQHPIVVEAMKQLAEDKCKAYNKNKIESKIEDLKESDLINSFNPGSPLQLQKFFEYYGIESTSTTKKNNPSWNRKELLKLKDFIEIMLDKGDNND